MNVINIAFTEINAKKDKAPKGSVNVSNNVKVVNLKESKLNLDKDRKTIEVEFEYTTTYNPDIGQISLKGRLLALDDENAVKDLLEKWEKDKKIDKESAPKYLNPIMNKAVLQTIILAREIELPSPIPMPNVKSN
ncbi:MAG: hypothetical protein ACMXX9_00815 [Candidatus Woesearchaeota archaeon]